MSYTEVTSENWFSRLGGSIKGILMGLLLIPISIVLLFWNEGREVKRSKALQEGAGKVVAVSAESVDSANDGQLVYLTGNVNTEDSIVDKQFGVVTENAIKLERNVLYYQYKENSETRKEKKLGGSEETTTVYSYEAQWVANPIDSTKFKDPTYRQSNTALVNISDKELTPKVVNLGAFQLSDSLAKRIQADDVLPLAPELKLPETFSTKPKIQNNEIYFGQNSTTPAIGDVRVSYKIALASDYSLIAQQQGNSFVTYQAKHGTISIFKKGNHSSEALFAQEEASNKQLSWVLRAVGFILMFIGFSAIFKPLSVVLDVIPFLGNIAEIGTGVIAFILTLVISSTTIAIAWLTYRPLIGGSLLLLAGGGIYWLISLKKKKALAHA